MKRGARPGDSGAGLKELLGKGGIVGRNRRAKKRLLEISFLPRR